MHLAVNQADLSYAGSNPARRTTGDPAVVNSRFSSNIRAVFAVPNRSHGYGILLGNALICLIPYKVHNLRDDMVMDMDW